MAAGLTGSTLCPSANIRSPATATRLGSELTACAILDPMQPNCSSWLATALSWPMVPMFSRCSTSEAGIHLHRPRQEADTLVDTLLGVPVSCLRPQQVEVIGLEVLRGFALGAGNARIRDHAVRSERVCDTLRHVCLHDEHARSWPVPSLRPDMGAGRRFDEVCRNAQAPPILLQ